MKKIVKKYRNFLFLISSKKIENMLGMHTSKMAKED